MDRADHEVAPVGDGTGRRVFRNTLLNGLGTFFTVAFSFALLPFAVHRLGAEAYGLWVLALSFSVTGGYLSLADLGLQQSLVKFVAEADSHGNHTRINEFVSSALALFLLMGACALVGLGTVAFFAGQLFNVPGDLAPALRLLLWLIAIEAAVGVPSLAFLGLLEGMQRYGVIRLVDFSRQVLYIALVVVLLTSGRGVVAFGAAMTISTIVGAALYYLAARHFVPGLAPSPRLVTRSALRTLRGFGTWLFLAKITGVAWRQMDKVILATLVSTSVLAGYDVANKIQATAAVVLSFAVSAIMPAASAMSAAGRTQQLRELLYRGTRYSVALSLPVVLGAMIMAGPLIVEWVGSEFEPMAGPTRMFLACQIFASASSVANTMLVGLGYARAVALFGSAALAVNLTISLVLARRFGITGVIAGTLAGYAITAPLYLRLAAQEFSVSVAELLRGSLLSILPSAAAFALVLELTRRAFSPESLLTVFLVCVPAALIYLVGVGGFAASADERRMLVGFVVPRGRR